LVQTLAVECIIWPQCTASQTETDGQTDNIIMPLKTNKTPQTR